MASSIPDSLRYGLALGAGGTAGAGTMSVLSQFIDTVSTPRRGLVAGLQGIGDLVGLSGDQLGLPENKKGSLVPLLAGAAGSLLGLPISMRLPANVLLKSFIPSALGTIGLSVSQHFREEADPNARVDVSDYNISNPFNRFLLETLLDPSVYMGGFFGSGVAMHNIDELNRVAQYKNQLKQLDNEIRFYKFMTDAWMPKPGIKQMMDLSDLLGTKPKIIVDKSGRLIAVPDVPSSEEFIKHTMSKILGVPKEQLPPTPIPKPPPQSSTPLHTPLPIKPPPFGTDGVSMPVPFISKDKFFPMLYATDGHLPPSVLSRMNNPFLPPQSPPNTLDFPRFDIYNKPIQGRSNLFDKTDDVLRMVPPPGSPATQSGIPAQGPGILGSGSTSPINPARLNDNSLNMGMSYSDLAKLLAALGLGSYVGWRLVSRD